MAGSSDFVCLNLLPVSDSPADLTKRVCTAAAKSTRRR